MRKILVISNMYPSLKDPVFGTFVKDFVDGLKEFAPSWNVERIVIAGRSNGLCEKCLKYFVFYVCIIFRLLFVRYDYVYVHLITHAAIPLRIVDFFRSLPLVFNVHGEDLLTQSSLASYLQKMVIPLLKKSKLIVLPSNYFQKRFEQLLPIISVSKLYVFPSGGVDTNLFRPSTTEKKRLTIGYVSRIDRGKGWNTFLEAINLLDINGIDVDALMIGRGDEVELLKNKIKKFKLANVEFVGAIPHELLPEKYVQMDLFVFPTQLEESLGLVGLEAMACGVPVIGSCIGGLTDYIKEGENGYFFNPGDAVSLVDSILKYIESSNLTKLQMKENAVNTAQRFSKKHSYNMLCRRLEMC